MLYKILLSLIIVSVPAMAHAQIYSNTSASSNSGGNVVGPGGTVTTGDSSASVQVTTNTSSSNTSTIEIKTNVNGVVHEESRTTTGATNVEVVATPAQTTIKIQEGTPPVTVKHEVVTAAGSSSAASASNTATTTPYATTSPQEPGLGAQIVLAVQSFLAGLLSWFK